MGRTSTKTVFLSLILIGGLSVAGLRAEASGIDAQSRKTLIEKLSNVYLNLAPSDPSKVAITLRLADLHSERARADSMAELDAGCTKCTAGREDRIKALRYYNEVVSKVPESSIGKVLTQIGHLYEMTGNDSEAVSTYNRIISENRSPAAVAEAHLSLGELYFKRRNYADAKPHLKHVVNYPQATSRGLASYRIAWCDFNQENLNSAIDGLVKILRTPELLSRNGGEVAQADRQFQEEVSRDLATFLARRAVTIQDAKLVFDLSPEQAKTANTVYLASETERLGQIQAAIALWRFVQERQSSPQARLEGHVHLAQLEMQQKLLPDAIRDYEMALALWAQLGATCKEAECKELKARLRNFVVDWNRAEAKAPSEQLLAAYQSYLRVFSGESDMIVAAGRIASEQKQYALSIQLYQEGAALDVGAKDKAAAERLEAALLGAIESAELSKDPKLLASAYKGYLANSRARQKALEVQYQTARLIYDRGENEKAAEALKAVVFSKETGAASIKKQAADLSLDALVLLKDDVRLEAWANEYAKVLPKEGLEFSAIARKSILTQSAQAGQKATAEGLKSAWAVLSRFDLGTATADDKAAFYKNKLILAEKLQRYGDAREAADGLLNLKNVSAEDREYALSRKAWLAELVLDFETALTATEKIPARESEAGQRWLKLAMYAELAAKDPKPYYGQYLKGSKDEEKNAAIAAQMVRDSKEPLKEIEKNRAALIKKPELLGDLYLEEFGKTSSSDVAKKALSTIPNTAAGKVIARTGFLAEAAQLRNKITSQAIDGSTQKKMAQTLKARAALLAEVEKMAARAVTGGDWTSQLVALDLLAKQSDRFYQEVLSLPVPQGLSAEEEQQYLSLLSQQAAPHQVRASDVSKKVSEFWSNQNAIDQLDEAMARETGSRRALLKKEIQSLIEVAPEEKKAALQSIASREEPARGELPSMAVLEKARQGVRETPLNKERLAGLLELERKLGRKPMISYLETRIQSLETEK